MKEGDRRIGDGRIGYGRAGEGRAGEGRAGERQHSETSLMLKGYGLTTAEIFYRMPDYRSVLNTFIWQTYDLAPDYPELFRFIEYWQTNIEGPLHSVRFTHRRQIGPAEWRKVTAELRLQ